MIDVAREKLLTKEEAAQYCKVSVFTINRWISAGCKRTGRKLEKVTLGGSIRTSVEAIARFSIQTEEPSPVAPRYETESSRKAMEFFRNLDKKKARGKTTHRG